LEGRLELVQGELGPHAGIHDDAQRPFGVAQRHSLADENRKCQSDPKHKNRNIELNSRWKNNEEKRRRKYF
jgi:hypothetical protein